MALSVEVVKPLDGGRVQVDAKNKFFGKDIVAHYSVPENKADEFIADYKKEENKHTKTPASPLLPPPGEVGRGLSNCK